MQVAFELHFLGEAGRVQTENAGRDRTGQEELMMYKSREGRQRAAMGLS